MATPKQDLWLRAPRIALGACQVFGGSGAAPELSSGVSEFVEGGVSQSLSLAARVSAKSDERCTGGEDWGQKWRNKISANLKIPRQSDRPSSPALEGPKSIEAGPGTGFGPWDWRDWRPIGWDKPGDSSSNSPPAFAFSPILHLVRRLTVEDPWGLVRAHVCTFPLGSAFQGTHARASVSPASSQLARLLCLPVRPASQPASQQARPAGQQAIARLPLPSLHNQFCLRWMSPGRLIVASGWLEEEADAIFLKDTTRVAHHCRSP